MFTLQQGCDIQGKTGDQATLTSRTSDGKGQILFGESTYAGTALVPQGGTAAQLNFTLKSGRQKLEIFLFFVGTNAGELLEAGAAGASQHITDLFASEPSIRLFICGA
jgi:hypothetical protein